MEALTRMAIALSVVFIMSWFCPCCYSAITVWLITVMTWREIQWLKATFGGCIPIEVTLAVQRLTLFCGRRPVRCQGESVVTGAQSGGDWRPVKVVDWWLRTLDIVLLCCYCPCTIVHNSVTVYCISYYCYHCWYYSTLLLIEESIRYIILLLFITLFGPVVIPSTLPSIVQCLFWPSRFSTYDCCDCYFDCCSVYFHSTVLPELLITCRILLCSVVIWNYWCSVDLAVICWYYTVFLLLYPFIVHCYWEGIPDTSRPRWLVLVVYILTVTMQEVLRWCGIDWLVTDPGPVEAPIFRLFSNPLLIPLLQFIPTLGVVVRKFVDSWLLMIILCCCWLKCSRYLIIDLLEALAWWYLRFIHCYSILLVFSVVMLLWVICSDIYSCWAGCLFYYIILVCWECDFICDDWLFELVMKSGMPLFCSVRLHLLFYCCLFVGAVYIAIYSRFSRCCRFG